MVLRIQLTPQSESPQVGVQFREAGGGLPSAGALVVSLLLHIVGLPLLPVLLIQESGRRAEPVSAVLVDARTTQLLLRLPPRAAAMLPATGRVARSGAGRREPGRQARRAASRSPGPQILLPLPETRVERPVWEIPTIAVWTGTAAPAPLPIVPGAVRPLTAAQLPAVVPSLERPIAEGQPGGMAIPRPGPGRSPLVLRPSSPSPAAVWLDVEDLPAAPPGSLEPGVPAAVIAVTSLGPRPEEAFRVPPSGTADGPRATKGAGSEPAEAVPPVTAAVMDLPPGPVVAAGGQTDSAAGRGAAGIPGSEGALKTFSIDTAAGAILVAEWPDGTRRLTYPEGGRFDVLVVGAGLPPGVPPIDDVLEGRPVYTAYLQVGLSRDWILQFCVDARQRKAVRRTGMVISLGNETRLESPYVRFAQIPQFRKATGYTAFHFRISAGGEVEEPRMLASGQMADPGFLSMIGSWKFRAAARDGQAVAVEAVLVVPPEKVDE